MQTIKVPWYVSCSAFDTRLQFLMPQKSLIPTVKKKIKKESSNHLSTNQDAAHPGRCWFLYQSVQNGQEQQLLLQIIKYTLCYHRAKQSHT